MEKENLDSVPFARRTKFSLCLIAMKITEIVAIITGMIEISRKSMVMGQESIARVVESDIYLVIKSNIIISAVATAPTSQSTVHIAERQTKKPLPPSKPYHIGKA